MNHITRLLKTFDYHSITAFGQSLAPSSKYGNGMLLMMLSAVWVDVDKIFGLDASALLALMVVFVAELTTGIVAAHVRKERFSSVKLSRFTLKVTCYVILIGATYLMAESFQSHKKDVAGWVMDWLHVFLTVQIVLENVVSILENIAVINGKEKPAYISKIQDKFNSMF